MWGVTECTVEQRNISSGFKCGKVHTTGCKNELENPPSSCPGKGKNSAPDEAKSVLGCFWDVQLAVFRPCLKTGMFNAGSHWCVRCHLGRHSPLSPKNKTGKEIIKRGRKEAKILKYFLAFCRDRSFLRIIPYHGFDLAGVWLLGFCSIQWVLGLIPSLMAQGPFCVVFALF